MELLTHKALLLIVPERSGSHPIGDQCEEGLLDLQRQGSRPFSQWTWVVVAHKSSVYLKGRIKDDQLGTGGYEVITAVGLHEPGVDIVLGV